MSDPTQGYQGPPTMLQNVGSSIAGALPNVPPHIQRLVAALKSIPTTLRANPQDPGNPEGIGGAAHRQKLDEAIAAAGG